MNRTYEELMAERDAAERALWRRYEPTPAELAERFGPSWGICRSTPTNRERYGRCLSRREYEAGVAAVLNARDQQP